MSIEGRDSLVNQVADEYRNGATLRALADKHGIGYGTARLLAVEGGVVLRPRGGNVQMCDAERRAISSRLEGGA